MLSPSLRKNSGIPLLELVNVHSPACGGACLLQFLWGFAPPIKAVRLVRNFKSQAGIFRFFWVLEKTEFCCCQNMLLLIHLSSQSDGWQLLFVMSLIASSFWWILFRDNITFFVPSWYLASSFIHFHCKMCFWLSVIRSSTCLNIFDDHITRKYTAWHDGVVLLFLLDI